MPDLFGLDIAGIVASSIGAAGDVRPGTLVHKVAGTRGAGTDVLGGTNPTTTNHTFRGFVETRTPRRAESLVENPIAVVSILGATLEPAVKPDVGDVATIDGEVYTLVELLNADPARALYEFRGEEA